MDKKEEFDLDFDFEKEYGFDPSLMDNIYGEEDNFDTDFLTDESAEEVPAEAAPAEPAMDDTMSLLAAVDAYDPAVFGDPVPEEPAPEAYYAPAQEAYPAAESDEYPAEAEAAEEVPVPAPAEKRRRKKKQAKPSFFAALFAPKSQAEKPRAHKPAPVPESAVFAEEDVPVAYAPEEAAPAEAPVAFAPVEIPENQQPMQDLPVQEAPVETPVEEVQPAQASQPKRRRKKTKEQIFKEVYLPPIIAGVALVLILIMVIGSIVRAVNNGRANSDKDAQLSSQQAALDAEAERLLAEAAVLAAGYDYEGAIALLDSFSGDQTAYPDMVTARSTYAKQQGELVEWKDPSSIPNLSFQMLIADPSRAFTDEGNGRSYNRNFVTTGEFEKILQQLYDNGYVLVNLEDVVFTTTIDGKTTYSANTICLPAGKKPIMITQTMVNYYGYMIDSDDDGVADAGGAGFASRLVLEDGEVVAEMVTASGETVRGNYDLVPILNDFIEAHPDFSYRGARAILAVTGDEGVFGYRTQNGDAAEIAAAQEVVQALRDDGYVIGCYTYSNMNYSSASATEIQADLQKWTAQVVPVLGQVDVLVFAKSADISDYNGGNQYNVLYNAGFRYFIGAANQPWAQVSNDYFHQKRIMVTGSQMAHGSSVFTNYFNAMAVLDSTRGNVPN